VAPVDERAHPPGRYDVVVVGSGPGGLQVSYYLRHFGVQHAVLSRDEAPGGMFQRFPIYQRLISWTKPDAPAERGSREYEWYDHNSLVAEEPELRALVPQFMARDFDLPSRAEMLQGLVEFAERAQLVVRYGCAWERTRRERDELVLETSDGEYRCRAAVFAIGITEPWIAPVPGLEHAAHYVDTREAEAYVGRRVFVVGKRNSGFEVAQTLLPWARQVILASPRPVQTKALALSALRVRYLHPYDEYARGGPGTYVLDAAIDKVERTAHGFRVLADGTSWEGRFDLEVDDVIAATGFRAPLRDLPQLGVTTVSDGRMPALTPFWESVSVPGLFFAGNTTMGARGVGKRGLGASSSAVNGFRYNARVLAEHLARRLGRPLARVRLPPREVVPFLLNELSHAPELWIQKGYLARVLTFADGVNDHGMVPVSHFLDEAGPDAVAATIEVDETGTIFPILYLRKSGRVSERPLPPHPMHVYEDDSYRRAVEAILG
jgi:thioredoxin reductase